MRNIQKRAGFTLIELLIVIVIVSILASIGINLFWKAKDRSMRATLQSDLRTAAVQQEVYFERYNIYASNPADIPGFQASPGVVLTINHSASNGWAGITTHNSLAAVQCGIMVGDAPAGTGGAATTPGVIACN